MRFLKAYWPALVITLAAGAAVIYVGDGIVDLLLLLVAAAAWGALAARAGLQTAPAKAPSPARPADQSATDNPEMDTSVRRSICSIVDRVNLFIDEEVKILNESLHQIESLAKDAVATLSSSLHSLNHQVRSQSRLLHKLSGITAGATEEPPAVESATTSWNQFIEDSRTVIEYFLSLLEDVQGQRERFETVLKGIMVEVNRTRDAVDTLPPGTPKDVRLGVTRLRTLLQRQIQVFGESPKMERQRSDAALAIDRIEQARTQLEQMRDTVMMNIEAFARQSHKDVGRAVQSLQFEDIVSQLVTGAQGRLDEMNQLVSSLTRRVEYLKLVDADKEPIGALKVVEEIEMDVVTFTEKLRASRSKPVGQSNLDEGSVELF